MSTVTRKTDAFTATRGIATREAGAQAVTNEQSSTLYNGATEADCLKVVRDNSTNDGVESRKLTKVKLK